MPPHTDSAAETQERLAAERRLQVGAALLLGLIVLISIVLRAGVHNVFLPGWWRLW